jgi:hypothetical protein
LSPNRRRPCVGTKLNEVLSASVLPLLLDESSRGRCWCGHGAPRPKFIFARPVPPRVGVGNRRQPSSFAVARFERQPATRHGRTHALTMLAKPPSFAHSRRWSCISVAALGQRGKNVPHHPPPPATVGKLADRHA